MLKLNSCSVGKVAYALLDKDGSSTVDFEEWDKATIFLKF